MSLRFAPIKYSGNSTDDTDITGFDFPLSLVWVKPADTTANDGAMTWSVMGADTSFDPSSGAGVGAGLIKALNPGGVNGFRISASANVNSSGVDYYGMAFAGDATCYKEGTYVGNGTTSNPVTGVGIEGDLIFIKRAGGSAGRFYIRNSNQACLWTASNGSAGFLTTNSDGFTLTSSSSQVNAAGATYYYVVIKFEAGFSEAGNFNGNATDNRSIATSFPPEGVIMKANSGAQAPIFRTTENSGDDTSIWISSTANASDRIQSLGTTTNEFVVGTNAQANRASTVMTWMAFRDNPPATFSPKIMFY